MSIETQNDENIEINNVFDWLKENNRLDDITKYKISEINNDKNGKTSLSDLWNLQTSDTYGHLEVQEKTLLLALSKIADAKQQIDHLISEAKINDMLKIFTIEVRVNGIKLFNLKDKKIQNDEKKDIHLTYIDEITEQSTIDNLTPEQRKLLLDLANISNVEFKIDKLIFEAQREQGIQRVNISQMFSWLKGNDHLKDIKLYKINELNIQDKQNRKIALSVLAKITEQSTIDDLKPEQRKSLLYIFELLNWKYQIRKLIINAKKDRQSIEKVWEWLKKDDLLLNVSKYNVLEIYIERETVVFLTELLGLHPQKDNYFTFTKAQKDVLLILGKISDASNQINNKIAVAKKIDDMLTWLQTGTRLANIKNYQNKDVLLKEIKGITKQSTYKLLTPEQRKLLLDFSDFPKDLQESEKINYLKRLFLERKIQRTEPLFLAFKQNEEIIKNIFNLGVKRIQIKNLKYEVSSLLKFDYVENPDLYSIYKNNSHSVFIKELNSLTENKVTWNEIEEAIKQIEYSERIQVLTNAFWSDIFLKKEKALNNWFLTFPKVSIKGVEYDLKVLYKESFDFQIDHKKTALIGNDPVFSLLSDLVSNDISFKDIENKINELIKDRVLSFVKKLQDKVLSEKLFNFIQILSLKSIKIKNKEYFFDQLSSFDGKKEDVYNVSFSKTKNQIESFIKDNISIEKIIVELSRLVKERRQILINNFQKEDSFLKLLKKLNKKVFYIEDERIEVRELLKINWLKNNIQSFSQIKPKAEEELKNLYRFINKKEGVSRINKSLKFFTQNKEINWIFSLFIMFYGFFLIGLFLFLLKFQLFFLKKLRKAN